MDGQSFPKARPLTLREVSYVTRERAKSPEREGTIRIESLRRDAAGKLWISFVRTKQGYMPKKIHE